MKIRFSPLLLVAAFFLPLTGFGQFVDDEASAKLFAVQCKVSPGFAGGEYDEYGRKPAKTLFHVSAAQQERIFAYVPNLGDTGIDFTSIDSHAGAIPADAGEESALSGALASIGDLFIPSEDEPMGIIAGVDPEGAGVASVPDTGTVGSGETTTIADSGSASSGDAAGSAWVDPLFGWLADDKDNVELASAAGALLGGLTDSGLISDQGDLSVLEPGGQDVDLAAASAAIIEIDEAQALGSGSGGSGSASASAGGSPEEPPNIDWGALFGGWEN